jgi:hypothetical protein
MKGFLNNVLLTKSLCPYRLFAILPTVHSTGIQVGMYTLRNTIDIDLMRE